MTKPEIKFRVQTWHKVGEEKEVGIFDDDVYAIGRLKRLVDTGIGMAGDATPGVMSQDFPSDPDDKPEWYFDDGSRGGFGNTPPYNLFEDYGYLTYDGEKFEGNIWRNP